MEKFTVDTILEPPLRISQPANGYRFTIDPVILAAQVKPAPGFRILDMGCGCGIIPLLLARRHPDTQIIGIERQKILFQCAQQNVQDNPFNNIQLLHGDIRTLELDQLPGRLDMIVSNPPYIKRAAGRINPDSQKAMARHEITLDIDQICRKASQLLTSQGSLHIIFPALREQDLHRAICQAGLHVVEQLPIFSTPDNPPLRILVKAQKKETDQYSLKPPLYLHRADGTPTKEYFNLFNA